MWCQAALPIMILHHVTAVVMLLMSYVLMPRMTRWFAFWLFPRDRSEER